MTEHEIETVHPLALLAAHMRRPVVFLVNHISTLPESEDRDKGLETLALATVYYHRSNADCSCDSCNEAMALCIAHIHLAKRLLGFTTVEDIN